MSIATLNVQEKIAAMSPEEWKSRQELACAYRLFDHYGWDGLIFNHITVRVPGEGTHFLINPFGLMYREVTASNLVKIDVDGNILDGSPHKINKAGFVIHSALHMARPDAHAIMHTHTNEGVAVSSQEEGLMPLSMSACGPTLGAAFSLMRRLQSACEVQVMATAGSKRPMLPSKQSIETTVRQMKQGGGPQDNGQMLWDAVTRWMVDKDPSFLQ